MYLEDEEWKVLIDQNPSHYELVVPLYGKRGITDDDLDKLLGAGVDLEYVGFIVEGFEGEQHEHPDEEDEDDDGTDEDEDAAP